MSSAVADGPGTPAPPDDDPIDDESCEDGEHGSENPALIMLGLLDQRVAETVPEVDPEGSRHERGAAVERDKAVVRQTCVVPAEKKATARTPGMKRAAMRMT